MFAFFSGIFSFQTSGLILIFFLYFFISGEHFVVVQNIIFFPLFVKVAVVAIILALGFAFYVFFAPFVW